MPIEPSRSSAVVVQHIVDLMGRFGAVQTRPMFGGHGLFRDGLMFAILIKGGCTSRQTTRHAIISHSET
jgi:TfoX/Sxy family transcriptional regulator of competence genes